MPLAGPGAGRVNGCRVSEEAPVAAVRAAALAAAVVAGAAAAGAVAAVGAVAAGSKVISHNKKELIVKYCQII